MQRVGLGDRGDVDDEVAVFPDVDEGVFEGESVGAGLQADRQYRRGTPPGGGGKKGGGGPPKGGERGGGGGFWGGGGVWWGPPRGGGGGPPRCRSGVCSWTWG